MLLYYELPLLTPLLTPPQPPPHSWTCQTMPHRQYSWPGSSSLPTPDDAREARWWCKGPDDTRDVSKERSQETRGMQARKRCKGHYNTRDAGEAALWGRQRRKGGDCCRIVVVDATCNNSHINSNKYFFSSFNDVDLSHIMLVDCCMLCCRECGPIAAVWRQCPPWWSNWIAFLPILPSFLSRYTRHKSAKPQVRPRTNHLSNQISTPILSRWGWFT